MGGELAECYGTNNTDKDLYCIWHSRAEYKRPGENTSGVEAELARAG